MFRPNAEPQNARRSRPKGFTLVELMMTLLILGLILSVIYRVFSSQEHMFRTQEQAAAMQENLRTTMEYLNQEMSWIGYKVPGTSVVKASPTDIVFKANIPNTSTPIQYVRYRFDSPSASILRWAGPDASYVDTNSVVMATDIQSMSFSFFNVLNNQIVADTSGTPLCLCSNELSTDACSPCTPALNDVRSLLMIQRIKSRVTARTSREDFTYTDPDDGDHYRKRRGVLDVRARNIEDATWVAGQIGSGYCGHLVPHLEVPTGGYNACRDKVSMMDLVSPGPDMTNGWSDNPKLWVEAFDENGNANANTEMRITITARGKDGLSTLFRTYDPLTTSPDASIANSVIRYIVAGDLSDVSEDNQIEVTFNYLDGVCTMVIVEAGDLIDLISDDPSHFDTSGSYGSDGLDVRYINLSSGSAISPVPDEVALCSAGANEGVLLKARLLDDCANPIEGETVAWDDAGAGGTFSDVTAGADGVYSAVYTPPNSMSSPAPAYTVNLSAQWGSTILSTSETLTAANPYDIIIDSIVEQSGSGLYQFSSDVLPDNGSNFEIERVDGQNVRIDFHLEDQCGNRVYVDKTAITLDQTSGEESAVDESDGLYWFTWKSTIGCGAAQPGNTITIGYGSLSETVGFDLIETQLGSRLILDLGGSGILVAGDTSDNIPITASVTEYNESLQLCVNVPGIHDITFDVEGDNPPRSGSFSGTEFDVTSTSATTDTVTGIATVDLYSGTAQCPGSAVCDALTLTATADIDGAPYVLTLGVSLKSSEPDETFSGFMHSDYNEANKVGEDKSDRSYDPGETVYFQIKDFDENESPYSTDSASPVYTKVTLTSERTGDSETVNLLESLPNSALFRGQIDAVLSTAAVLEDGELQVRYGDYIHMHYVDKDDAAEFDDWYAFISGPRSMDLYLVDGSVETDIFSGSIQVENVEYEDDIRVRIYRPDQEGDGSSDTAIDSLNLASGSDTDNLQLREVGDTGVFVPDWTIYGSSTFRVTENDPSDQAYRLYIQSTPRTVTVSYPNETTPILEKSFFLYDQDGPTVVITAPLDGSTVYTTVLVTVNTSDVGNTSGSGGISKVELYINGVLYDAYAGTGDLSGNSNFTWTTTIGLNVVWLDGTHVLTAKAYDMMGNETQSAPVTVTLDNNIIPIEFTAPPVDSVWGSTTIPVEVTVSPLDSTGGPYQVYLSVSPDPAFLMSDAGSWTYTASLDGRTLPEGTRELIATVEDAVGNPVWTALNIDVDRTPPTIETTWNPDEWVYKEKADPQVFSFTVRDLHGFADSSNTVLVSLVGSNGFTDRVPNWISSTTVGDENQASYNFTWSHAMVSYEGTITWTVRALDSSNPPNTGTLTQDVKVDTIYPTLDAPTVSPTTGTFYLKGTVDISTKLNDKYPAFVGVTVYDVLLNEVASNMADTSPNVDGSGSYTWQWDTTTASDGEYSIHVTGWDEAGNEVQTDYNLTYYVDNTPPVCSRPYQYRNFVADDKVNIDYRVTDAVSGVKNVEFAFCLYPNALPAGPIVYSNTISFPSGTTLNTVMKTATFDVSSLANDRYYVYTRARDRADNQSSWSPALTAVLDRYNFRAVNVSYINMGVNYELTTTGMLYDGASPASGDSLMLRYRVLPAGSSTYEYPPDRFVASDVTGFYSDTYPSFLDSGDTVRISLYSIVGYQRGYIDVKVPNAPSYVSLQQNIIIENPALTYTYNSLLGEYTYEVGGVALDVNGPRSSAAIRIEYNHYDPSGGTYLGGGTINITSLGDGSFQAAIPGSYPTGDRISVYVYVDNIFTGAHYYRDPISAAYYYVPYTYPWF